MRKRPSWKSLTLLAVVLSTLSGCGMDRRARLMGRWFSKDVSIRFRKDGSVLYNSLRTGLVEGRYQYEPKQPAIASSKTEKNLTVWLPQPGRVAVLEFELRFLGNNRLQLEPISRQSSSSRPQDQLATGLVLKRAPDDNENSEALDETPPLVAANPDGSDE